MFTFFVGKRKVMSGASMCTPNPGAGPNLTLSVLFSVTISTDHPNSIITDDDGLLYFG